MIQDFPDETFVFEFVPKHTLKLLAVILVRTHKAQGAPFIEGFVFSWFHVYLLVDGKREATATKRGFGDGKNGAAIVTSLEVIMPRREA